jgi:hypothetical protein
MMDIRLSPLVTFPPGTYILGPVYIPDGVVDLQFKVRRCTSLMPNVWSSKYSVLKWAHQVSRDDRKGTWVDARIGAAEGGLKFRDDYTEEEFSIGTVKALGGRARWYQALIVVEGEAVFTEFFLGLV